MTEKEQTIDFPHSIESDSDSELSPADDQESIADQPYEHPERQLVTQCLHESLDTWRRASENLNQVKSEVGASVSEQSASDLKLAFLGRLRAAKEVEAGARQTIGGRLDRLGELDAIERHVNQERQKISLDQGQVNISPSTSWSPEALN